MSDDIPRKAWGAGRVALVARLDTIRSEMGQGLPLTGGPRPVGQQQAPF